MITMLIIIAVILLIGLVVLYGVLNELVDEQKRIRITLERLADSNCKLIEEIRKLAEKS